MQPCDGHVVINPPVIGAKMDKLENGLMVKQQRKFLRVCKIYSLVANNLKLHRSIIETMTTENLNCLD